METVAFTKMAGAGNDFIVVQAGKGGVTKKTDYRKLAITVCHRTNGIGADGVLVIESSKSSDYKMRIINADGSEAEMCGNGARCLAAYIVRYLKPSKKLFSIETLAGEILAEAEGEIANVRLCDPKDLRLDVPLKVNNQEILVQYIDTGVPHTILYVDNLAQIDVNGIGKMIRFHEEFSPRGTNVNFVEQLTDGLVEARTYERGVEAETKACGTGSVACGLVSYVKTHPTVRDKKNARMKVLTASGEKLDIQFQLKNGIMTDVWLKGSAKFIAEGKYFFNS